MIKPIVLIKSGDDETIVVVPQTPDSHTKETWEGMPRILIDACINIIDTPGEKLTVENIIALVESHPEWKCSATQGISLPTWQFVE